MQSPAPFFQHALTALSKILAKAETHAAAKKIKPDVLAQSRLIADMLPMWRQVTIACDHAKGACARLAGVDVPVFADPDHSEQGMTLPQLQDRIAQTLAFIQPLSDRAFEGAETRSITVKAGPRELTFPALQYLHGFAVPSFFFHMTTRHNILRANGVDVGKADFPGG